jgi:enoyl-CoA hydratase/carnithine racemase
MSYQKIIVDDPRPFVRRITLNRPEKRNPLSNELRTSCSMPWRPPTRTRTFG